MSQGTRQNELALSLYVALPEGGFGTYSYLVSSNPYLNEQRPEPDFRAGLHALPTYTYRHEWRYENRFAGNHTTVYWYEYTNTDLAECMECIATAGACFQYVCLLYLWIYFTDCLLQGGPSF